MIYNISVINIKEALIMKEYKLSKLSGRWCISYNDSGIIRIKKVFKDHLSTIRFAELEFNLRDEFLKNREINWLSF